LVESGDGLLRLVVITLLGRLLLVGVVMRLNVRELVALMGMLRVIRRLLIKSLGRHPATRDPHCRLTRVVSSVVRVRLIAPHEALTIVSQLFSLPSPLLSLEVLPLPAFAEETLLLSLDSTLDEEDDDASDEKGEGDTDSDKG
jgi:hypothetical protein